MNEKYKFSPHIKIQNNKHKAFTSHQENKQLESPEDLEVYINSKTQRLREERTL